MRMRARARAGDYTYFHNSIFPFFSIASQRQENDPSFYEK